MAVLVICGSGRGAGKTAVGCALIAALPEFRWVAVKVSPHTHDLPHEIWEETDQNSDKDTSRYLAACAARSFLLGGASDDQAALRAARARDLAPECDALLVESNQLPPASIARFEERTCCLAVLSGPEAAWKSSLSNSLAWADGLVLTDPLSSQTTSIQLLHKPAFRLDPGLWYTPELTRYVRGKLGPP